MNFIYMQNLDSFSIKKPWSYGIEIKNAPGEVDKPSMSKISFLTCKINQIIYLLFYALELPRWARYNDTNLFHTEKNKIKRNIFFLM